MLSLVEVRASSSETTSAGRRHKRAAREPFHIMILIMDEAIEKLWAADGGYTRLNLV